MDEKNIHGFSAAATRIRQPCDAWQTRLGEMIFAMSNQIYSVRLTVSARELLLRLYDTNPFSCRDFSLPCYGFAGATHDFDQHE
jgi:hypothetical protein